MQQSLEDDKKSDKNSHETSSSCHTSVEDEQLGQLFGDQEKVKKLVRALKLREPTRKEQCATHGDACDSYEACMERKLHVDEKLIKFIEKRREQDKKIDPALILQQLDNVIKAQFMSL